MAPAWPRDNVALLLLDVDGVLNPDFTTTWDAAAGENARAEGWVVLAGLTMNERPVWLNPGHGRLLWQAAGASDAQLVWATRWNDFANYVIAPTLGLPPLPVAPLHPEKGKAETVAPWAQKHPMVWLDDEEYVIAEAAALPNSAAVKISPTAGLAEADIERAAELLTQVRVT